MTSPVFLGIDLGTSGVRANAIDADGHLLGESRAPLPPSRGDQPGHREQEPADWWRATLQCIDALPQDLRRQMSAICVDGTSGTLLATDAAGEPLSAGLMYNDQRAVAQAQSLAQIAPPDAAVHSPSAAIAKLLWLEQHGVHAAHALHQADWIAFRLGAPLGISDENNCLKLGYDPVSRRWPDWLQKLPIPFTALPGVVPVGETTGRLSVDLRERWDCGGPVALIAGTTDSNAATLATGLKEVGDAATALGSTLVLKVLSDQPVYAPAYGIYSHRIGGRWLVGGASNSGGAVLRRFFSDRQLAELSARIDPSSDAGLDYYPLPGPGERFPLNDPALAPRLEPRPADDARFLHGLFEGMAHIEQLGYRRLQELGAPLPKRVKTTGGGAVNQTWRRLRERILGVPVEEAAHSEAAYGAALIAAGKVAW